jgi:uncharacterized protein VirK/YbjX
MALTADDVKSCYAVILGREAEDNAVVERLVSQYSSMMDLIPHFIHSDEFLARNFYGKVPSFLMSQQKYLFNDIGDKQRCECYFYHHNFLCEHILKCGYSHLISEGVIIHQINPKNILYQIFVQPSGALSYEGELSLCLMANGAPIFVMAFNIVPGKMFTKANEPAILITRIQGSRGKFETIKIFTKEINDIAPPHFLYSALTGIAITFGIDLIGGVCASKRFSDDPEIRDRFRTNYDGFFESIGAKRSDSGFFVSRISDKAEADPTAKAGHRARNRRKRKIKADVAHSVRMLSTLMFKSAPSSNLGDQTQRAAP